MTILDIPVKTLAGQESSLGAVAAPGPGSPGSGLPNRALLVVNVASKCGLTPQYTALEKLHEQFAARGFAVAGFPCNQFGGQEPGSAEQIAEFCSATYGVTFPMFGKIEVNGRGAHPLYRLLRRSAPGIFGTTAIKWNFTKFLVGRDGKVLERYAPTITPDEIEPDIVRALGMKRVVRSSKG